jgi:hypothetical protein
MTAHGQTWRLLTVNIRNYPGVRLAGCMFTVMWIRILTQSARCGDSADFLIFSPPLAFPQGRSRHMGESRKGAGLEPTGSQFFRCGEGFLSTPSHDLVSVRSGRLKQRSTASRRT